MNKSAEKPSSGGCALEDLVKQPLFGGMSVGEVMFILQTADAKFDEFLPGAVLEVSKKPARAEGQIKLLLSGIALNIKYDANGNRSILDYIMPGHVFQSGTFTRRGVHCQTTITAGNACLILTLTLPEKPESDIKLWLLLKKNIIEILAQKNRALLRKADVLSRRTLREKVLTYLGYERDIHGSDEFDIPLNRQELADYLYVDRTSLASEIGKLKREGVLACSRSHFILFEKSF